MSELEYIRQDVVIDNPERPAPPELLRQIVQREVKYIDFNNREQIGHIEMNQLVIDEATEFFRVAHHIKFPISLIATSSDTRFGWNDNILMETNTSSGFNYRTIKGTDIPSLHSAGLAFDVNPRLNPYIRYVEGSEYIDPPGSNYDPSEPGTLYADHPLVILMEKYGWQWGGNWSPESGRIDYQHFEKHLDEQPYN